MRPGVWLSALYVLTLAACQGRQSMLDTAGSQAGTIATLWWTMLAVSVIVILAVTGFLMAALFRRRDESEDTRDQDRRSTTVVAAGTGLTIAILIATFLYSMVVSRSAAALAVEGAQEIRVVGHQWWWEVTYMDSVSSRSFRTANELHLPAGQPVRLRLESLDVIHSFWAPNLHGKLDLIPGRENELWIRAERPGVYRGQCAEFCGLQHARMAFDVVVHEVTEFERWKESQLEPAPEPTDALAVRGREVFLGTPCAACHSVRGTAASGTAGPDLTHVGSRRSLGAGTAPNTPEHIAGWIANPQGMKPGNHMPRVPLPASDFTALLAYIATLR